MLTVVASFAAVGLHLVGGTDTQQVDARVPTAGAPAQRGGGTTTTRPTDPTERRDFLVVARSAFPELDEATAECIADGALPSLSPQVVATMLIDRDAPLKTTAEQREVLRTTINSCVDRSTAVEVVLRHLSQLSSRAPTLDGGTDLSYPELRCADDELGDLDIGRSFFSLYTAPLDYQELLVRVARECVSVERSASWLSSWADATWRVLPSPWEPFGPSEPQRLAPPTPARDCLIAVLAEYDDDTTARLVEQALLSASPDPLEGRLDDLHAWFAECGLPAPRRSGA